MTRVKTWSRSSIAVMSTGDGMATMTDYVLPWTGCRVSMTVMPRGRLPSSS